MGTYGTAKKPTTPHGLQAPGEWVIKSKCRNQDPEMFFSLSKHTIDRAKRVCSNCPVLADCKSWVIHCEEGLTLAFRFGVVGGMTPEERMDTTRNT